MKHKEIIKAWLDGAIVEAKGRDGQWTELGMVDDCVCFSNAPYFYPNVEYRIKPETIEVKFKLYKSTIDGECRPACPSQYGSYAALDYWTCISDEQTVEVPIKS